MARRPTTPQPPNDLSAAAKQFWRSVRDEYGIADAGGLAILARAAEALDRMQAARREIDRRGVLIEGTKGGLKSNPAVPVERDARAAFLAAVKMLHLDLEPLRDGPGRPHGN